MSCNSTHLNTMNSTDYRDYREKDELLLNVFLPIIIPIDIVSLIFFTIFLMYEIRKEVEENLKKSTAEFKNIYFFCTVLIINNTTNTIFDILLNVTEFNVFTFLFGLKLILFYFSFVYLIDSINLIFKFLVFLVAVQRIIFIYHQKYIFLITGKFLKVYLLIFYGVLIVYLFNGDHTCTYKSMIPQRCKIETILPFAIQIVLQFIISIASFLIYLHIYKLIKTLTDRKDEIFYIYQFMPLAFHQMIFSTFQLIIMLLSICQFDISNECEIFITIVFDIFNHSLPFVISMSYIASRENLRYLIVGVVFPFFERSSTQVGVYVQQNL
ncbi:unnamed protein product [Caenorhabditis angaria]|uniref:Uncharacterized protein n=1 Tax=Caenorhabditis angaria TaxID=860376 RepID=A0A9P1N6K5_9PELO|nr:unnamed protein product [Caenorhabditis angaria]